MNDRVRSLAGILVTCLLLRSPAAARDTAAGIGDQLEPKLEVVEVRERFVLFRASLTNTSGDPIFVVSKSHLSDSKTAPAVQVSESEPGTLVVSYVLWPLQDDVYLYRDGAGVVLSRLAPGAEATWLVQVDFPATSTVPPYGAAGRPLPSIPCSKIARVKVHIGVFDASAGLSALLARRKGRVIRAADTVDRDGRAVLLVETQHIISTKPVTFACADGGAGAASPGIPQHSHGP